MSFQYKQSEIDKIYYKDIPVARIVRAGETIWDEFVKLEDKTQMSKIYPNTYDKLEVIDKKFDGKDMTDATGMFKDCKALTALPVMKNMDNVTSFKDFAQACTSLKDVAELPTKQAKDLSGMFAYCTSLPEVFPWTIHLDSAESSLSIKDMFTGSSVKEATFECGVTKNVSYQDLKDNCGCQIVHYIEA